MNLKPVFGLLLALMVSGCCVYHPQETDIPLIDKKNDLRIDAGISVIGSANGTFSYGLTDKVAVQTFGSVGFAHKYYFQFAPGLYKKLGNQKVLEFYSGFGYGYANVQKDLFTDDISEYNDRKLFGNYQIYFVQFNWGKKGNQSGGIDWGFGLKTGLFHSNLTDENYNTIYSETGPYPVYKENNILIEPMWCFRTGSERVKFSYELGLTSIIKLSNDRNIIPAAYINMGFGVNFTPGKINKSLNSDNNQIAKH